jgi:hypothetical protein
MSGRLTRDSIASYWRRRDHQFGFDRHRESKGFSVFVMTAMALDLLQKYLSLDGTL